MESVDSFIQDSIFGDIVPDMSPDKSSPLRSAPTQATRATSRPAVKSALRPSLPANLPDFRVIRSARRTRSVSAYRQNGVIEIHIPAKLSRRDEYELIPEMIARVLRREEKSRSSDTHLWAMAEQLMRDYLPDFHERPQSISWRQMRERWGSCTTGDGTIRISLRLNGAPDYVVACVLFHELVHLREPGHGAEFEAYLNRFPDKERAEAFLEGFEAGLAAIPG